MSDTKLPSYTYDEPAVPVSLLKFMAEENRDAARHWRELQEHDRANTFHRFADELLSAAEQEEQRAWSGKNWCPGVVGGARCGYIAGHDGGCDPDVRGLS